MKTNVVMARERFSDEDVIGLLCQIEIETSSGTTVAEACRSAGVSDATHYGWRKKFGGMGPVQGQTDERVGEREPKASQSCI